VRDYTRTTLAFARDKGYVQTLLGRRRYLPEIHSGNFNIRQAAERAAVNMPIQGTAADIMKLAMIDVHRLLKEKCFECVLLLQVHDELVFAIQRDLIPIVGPQIVNRMEEAYGLSVHLRVDSKFGHNWAEMTSLRLA
jgi:DNA polymerase-1